MTTNVLVTFYSTYGHIHRMALAVAEGAEGVPDTAVQLRRIAELEEARKALAGQDAYLRAQQAQADLPVVTHDDLRWADEANAPREARNCATNWRWFSLT